MVGLTIGYILAFELALAVILLMAGTRGKKKAGA